MQAQIKLFLQALLLLLGLGVLSTSCISVANYQKMYLNDSDMELKARASEIPEINFQSYREGASGANKGKSGGGCGCN